MSRNSVNLLPVSLDHIDEDCEDLLLFHRDCLEMPATFIINGYH